MEGAFGLPYLGKIELSLNSEVPAKVAVAPSTTERTPPFFAWAAHTIGLDTMKVKQEGRVRMGNAWVILRRQRWAALDMLVEV